jgi:hypothetical protein
MLPLLASTSEAKWSVAAVGLPPPLPQSLLVRIQMESQVVFTRPRAGEAMPCCSFASLPCISRFPTFLAPLDEGPRLCPLASLSLAGFSPGHIKNAVTSLAQALLFLSLISHLSSSPPPLTVKDLLRSSIPHRRPSPPTSGNGLMKLHSFLTGLRTT